MSNQWNTLCHLTASRKQESGDKTGTQSPHRQTGNWTSNHPIRQANYSDHSSTMWPMDGLWIITNQRELDMPEKLPHFFQPLVSCQFFLMHCHCVNVWFILLYIRIRVQILTRSVSAAGGWGGGAQDKREGERGRERDIHIQSYSIYWTLWAQRPGTAATVSLGYNNIYELYLDDTGRKCTWNGDVCIPITLKQF